jgi:hypothetical protein
MVEPFEETDLFTTIVKELTLTVLMKVTVKGKMIYS